MIAVAVLVGGGLGAMVRDLVERWLEPSRPWATALVNVVGSILLGLVVGSGALLESFIGVGFCGALTTFSGYSVHVVRLVREGRPWLALAFTGLSTAGALIGYWLVAGF